MIPEFEAPTTDELRALWLEHRGAPGVRRAVLEVIHLRSAIRAVEELRQSIARVWEDEVGGHLVALYQLQIRLRAEHYRMGIMLSGTGPAGGVATEPYAVKLREPRAGKPHSSTRRRRFSCCRRDLHVQCVPVGRLRRRRSRIDMRHRGALSGC
jgi:hypothetical protein